MNRPVPAPRFYGPPSDVTTSTSSSHGSHPGHSRKDSWGNPATFVSHGIPSHRMSPKHDSPSGSPRMNELSPHLKNSIASSLAAVHNNHMAQTGRAMSTEGMNLKPTKAPGLGTRSSGSLDNHNNTGNRGNSGDSGNRGNNRGHRGSNASLGPSSVDASSGSKLRKLSQDRGMQQPTSFAFGK